MWPFSLFRSHESRQNNSQMTPLERKVVSSMILAGVGDAFAYKNGEWEFCRHGEAIQAAVKSMGGIEKIIVKPPQFILSDDTVMCIATAEALTSSYKNDVELFVALARYYKECMKDMVGRAPGNQTMKSTAILRPNVPNGWTIPFCPRGVGCGAAMRATPIGLFYYRADQVDDLVRVAIESGRITHNHPVGCLGALASAFFTSLAMQECPLELWGEKLLALESVAWKHIETSGREVEEHRQAWPYFWKRWRQFLSQSGLLSSASGDEPVTFRARTNETVAERDAFYTSLSCNGWGGSAGHDAPMIAYDALLHAKQDWKELCYRALFHCGDSDSTGILAGAWYGALYGMDGVPPGNYQHLEYRDRLAQLGKDLAAKASGKMEN